jgi:hypothetical protein
MQLKPQTKATLLSALALAAIFALGAANAAPQNHRIDLKASGLYGLANGQIARINAAHVGNTNEEPVPIEMLFLDSTGAVLARDTQTVMPGKAVSFDLPFSAFVTTENRIQLRAVVRSAAPSEGYESLRISVELFDEDTGKTAVFISSFNN